jgi:hypothetical protein
MERANAGGEPDDDRAGHVADQPAETEYAHGDEDDAGQEGDHRQGARAMDEDDMAEQRYKRCRGPGDVVAGAAEDGGCGAGENGGVQARDRRDADRYGEGDRERQGDNPGHHAGHGIRAEFGEGGAGREGRAFEGQRGAQGHVDGSRESLPRPAG